MIERRASGAAGSANSLPIGPFGETLTWPSWVEWRRRNEEQRLVADPLAQAVVDGVTRRSPARGRRR